MGLSSAADEGQGLFSGLPSCRNAGLMIADGAVADNYGPQSC